MVGKIKNFILDTLFPIECLACGKPKKWICNNCQHKIPFRQKQVCPLCEEKETPAGQTCFNCQNKHTIDGILVASRYRKNRQRLVAQAVHYFKYRFVKSLDYSLGEILKKSFWNSDLSLPDIIIPIPLHARRLRWRGFNQSYLLAKHLSQKLTPGFEIALSDKILFRSRYTPPQAKIKDYQQRKNNLREAFQINQNQTRKIINKNILLVDDISTTGSTLFECAKVLKKAGAKQVFGIILARQEIDN
jgi:ComF family protein